MGVIYDFTGSSWPIVRSLRLIRNVNRCSVPCLVDPDKLGDRLLLACGFNLEEYAIQLLEEGEWI